MTALVPRLARVLGMMDSTFDGEVVAAGRMATKIVKAAGMTWEDVLAAPPGFASERREAKSPSPDWREVVATCRARADLTPWEIAFLARLATYQHPPSERQCSILADIASRRG